MTIPTKTSSRTKPYHILYIKGRCWGVFHSFGRNRHPKQIGFDPCPLEWTGQDLVFHSTTGPLVLGTRAEGHTIIRSPLTWAKDADARFKLGTLSACMVTIWLEEFMTGQKLKHLIARGPLEEHYLAEVLFEATLKGV